jgi:ribose transport system substrate-binding protein
MSKPIQYLFALILLIGPEQGVPATEPEAEAQGKFVIGFSQATTTEPWRLLFNKELRATAAAYPEIELIVRNGMDDTTKQVADVEEFIARGVDIILISPKVSDGLTPVVNKAFDAGIPVIVLDRDLVNARYTQFIGGDNQLIGRMAGRYAMELLGGPGRAKGKIVEIWGGMASTPAQHRHEGFHEVIDKEPGIAVLNLPADGDWKQDIGYDIMSEALELYPQIDLVFAHNDPMAYGAYLAAKDTGQEQDIFFLGIDGIPAEGVRWVHESILTATFHYRTPGEEGIRQALKLLNGEVVAKRITLPTTVIDKHNAEAILRRNNMLN